MAAVATGLWFKLRRRTDEGDWQSPSPINLVIIRPLIAAGILTTIVCQSRTLRR